MYFISVAHAGVITNAPSISSVGMKILFFLLSVVGIVAIIALVLAGFLYFLADGDKKKVELAKRAIHYSVLGVFLAMGGMVLVRLMGQFFSTQ